MMELQEPPRYDHNPFMLMMHPEVVFAAMERSQHLGQLNRHLCRPLDRMPPAPAGAADASDLAIGDDADGDDETAV